MCIADVPSTKWYDSPGGSGPDGARRKAINCHCRAPVWVSVYLPYSGPMSIHMYGYLRTYVHVHIVLSIDEPLLLTLRGTWLILAEKKHALIGQNTSSMKKWQAVCPIFSKSQSNHREADEFLSLQRWVPVLQLVRPLPKSGDMQSAGWYVTWTRRVDEFMNQGKKGQLLLKKIFLRQSDISNLT